MRTQSQQLGDAGCQLVLWNESDSWKERFLAFLESYARTTPHFRCEDVRAAFYASGNEPPHHSGVFGAISRQITKRGIGVPCGYVKSASPATHGHPVLQYKSKLFKAAQ